MGKIQQRVLPRILTCVPFSATSGAGAHSGHHIITPQNYKYIFTLPKQITSFVYNIIKFFFEIIQHSCFYSRKVAPHGVEKPRMRGNQVCVRCSEKHAARGNSTAPEALKIDIKILFINFFHNFHSILSAERALPSSNEKRHFLSFSQYILVIYCTYDT